MGECILAGDVGGTKANLALLPADEGGWAPLKEATLPSGGFEGLESLVQTFLGQDPAPLAAACLGIAGAVRDGSVESPNLPWRADRERLRRALGLSRVELINDLLATAYGLEALPPERLAVLNPGAPGAAGTRALVAAGTGLGEAVLYWDGQRHLPFPSEGGHADFAPRGELQVELLRYLDARFGRTSVERVLSGPGLVHIYRFLLETGRGTQPGWLAAELEKGDPAAAIAEAGLSGRDPLCAQALDLFVRVYGAEAGNLALKAFATGGVYLGGGIAPKILPKLRERPFLEAFVDKGRLSVVLADIPVWVILDPKTALYGAAVYARRMLGQG
ncbi:MAG: glucokinase [Deferrisomatales bacterium]